MADFIWNEQIYVKTLLLPKDLWKFLETDYSQG